MYIETEGSTDGKVRPKDVFFCQVGRIRAIQTNAWIHSLAPPCGGGGGSFTSENPNETLQPPDLLPKRRQRHFLITAPASPQAAVTKTPVSGSTIVVFYKGFDDRRATVGRQFL